MTNDNGGHTIGQNELGEIRACGCGGVNLAMGPMTLHFAPEELEALSELVAAAREALDAAGRRSRRTKRGKGKSKAHGTLH